MSRFGFFCAALPWVDVLAPPACVGEEQPRQGGSGDGGDEVGLEPARLVEQLDGPKEARGRVRVEMELSSDREVPGIDRTRALPARCRFSERRAEMRDDRFDELVLNLEDVAEVAVVALGPDVMAGLCVDQPGGDTDAAPVRLTLPSTTWVASSSLAIVRTLALRPL